MYKKNNCHKHEKKKTLALPQFVWLAAPDNQLVAGPECRPATAPILSAASLSLSVDPWASRVLLLSLLFPRHQTNPLPAGIRLKSRDSNLSQIESNLLHKN